MTGDPESITNRSKSTKILEELPLLVAFALGAAILWPLGWTYAMLYLGFGFFSLFWFMRFICTSCANARLNRCHSIMGDISQTLFRERDTATFTRQFKRHVAVLFPNWFIPPIAALVQLFSDFTVAMLILLVLFCLVAFVILPVFSSKGTCDECAVREECPWSKARSSG